MFDIRRQDSITLLSGAAAMWPLADSIQNSSRWPP
jgi:hypothetical protein